MSINQTTNMKMKLLPFCFLFIAVFTITAAAQTYYVKPGATGDGSSWANASGDLQATINAAVAGSQIWVVKGSYKPATSGTSFSMKNNVQLYGGFVGSEAALSARDSRTNVTILVGNGSSVVLNNNVNNAAVLDGFTVTGGTGYSSGIANFGGGMCNFGSSPHVTNCIFSNNNSGVGAGMRNDHTSSPIVMNSAFNGNTATVAGGGMENADGATPVVLNCVFSKNTSQSGGGGMYNTNGVSPTITNCVFTENSDGIYNSQSSSPTIVNCVFNKNTNLAIYDYYICNPKIINCVFNGNGIAGVSYALGGYPTIVNSIFFGNGFGGTADIVLDNGNPPVITYSFLQSNIAGSGNIVGNASPFLNVSSPIGADSIWGTVDDGLNLNNISPAINAGNNAAVPTSVLTDITGAVRIQSGTVDMGPYESGFTVTPLRLLSFNAFTVGLYDQLQWKTAQEMNTKNFEVQYCTDAVSFETVGVVNANGNGNGSYSYEHTTKSLISFYRLKMNDVDGNFTYSNIVKLGSISTVDKASIIFPSPVSNLATIKIGSQTLLGTSAKLVNMSGQVLKYLPINSNSVIIEMGNYAKGIYYVQLQNAETLKVIKQ